MNTPSTPLQYQCGFGNEYATEAVTGALPQGRNSPQRAPLNLYPELISGTAFTAPAEVRTVREDGPGIKVGLGIVHILAERASGGPPGCQK